MRNRAQTSKQQQAREQVKDQPIPPTKQKFQAAKMYYFDWLIKFFSQ